MTSKLIPIKNVNGGLSETIYRGIEGSFYRSVGTDIWSKNGVIQASQKPTKDSGTTITALCKYAIVASDGNTYWAGNDGNDGKIWKRTSAGSWSLVYTSTSDKIYGFVEHNGYFYWATASSLYKVATNSADWATDKVKVGDFPNGTTPHPMKVHLTELYIGDGKDVVVASDPTSSVLDLHPDFTIQALESAGIDLLIGAKVSNTNRAGIFRWNCNDPSWNFEDYINEDGINAMIVDNFTNDVIVSAGSQGNIYSYDGYSLRFRRKIPGDYSPSAKSIVNSMANFGDKILIGVSNSTGNPCLQGVYVYRNESYPRINLDYVISQNKTSDIEIGAILVQGQDIFFAWKDGTTYGVDKVDWNTKYSGAYFETMLLEPDVYQEKLFQEFRISTEDIPTSCSIAVSYKKDGDTSYTAVNGSPITSGTFNTLNDAIESRGIQLKFVLTTSGNNSPAVKEFYVGYDISQI